MSEEQKIVEPTPEQQAQINRDMETFKGILDKHQADPIKVTLVMLNLRMLGMGRNVETQAILNAVVDIIKSDMMYIPSSAVAKNVENFVPNDSTVKN